MGKRIPLVAFTILMKMGWWRLSFNSHGTISPFLYGGEKEEGRKKEKIEKYGQNGKKKI